MFEPGSNQEFARLVFQVVKRLEVALEESRAVSGQ